MDASGDKVEELNNAKAGGNSEQAIVPVPVQVPDSVDAGADARESEALDCNWWVVFLTCVACTVCAIEVLLTNLNIVYIVGSIGITPDEFTWIIATFFFGQFLGVALCAQLIRTLCTRRFLLIMLAAFSVFELIAAHAGDSFVFGLSRLGAGFVNGAITTASLIFIVRKIPFNKRLLTYFFFSSPAIFAPPIALIASGLAIENYSWRSMYEWASITGIVLLVAILLMAKPNGRSRLSIAMRRFNFTGILLLMFSAGSYCLLMMRGTTENWLDSSFIQALIACNIAGWTGFIWHQFQNKGPYLINTRLLRDPHILAMAVLNALYGVVLAYMLLVSGFLVLTQDANSIQIGMCVLAAGLCIPFVVSRYKSLDFRLLILLGALFCAASGLINSNLTRLEDGNDLLISQLVRSVGLTLFLWPLWNLIMNETHPRDYEEAAKIYTFSRVLGVPAGIGLVGALQLWRNNFHSEHVNESLTDDVLREGIAAMKHYFISTGSSIPQAGKQAVIATAKHVRAETLVLAYGDSFWIMGIVALLALCCLLFVRSNTDSRSLFDVMRGR